MNSHLSESILGATSPGGLHHLFDFACPSGKTTTWSVANKTASTPVFDIFQRPQIEIHEVPVAVTNVFRRLYLHRSGHPRLWKCPFRCDPMPDVFPGCLQLRQGSRNPYGINCNVVKLRALYNSI